MPFRVLFVRNRDPGIFKYSIHRTMTLYLAGGKQTRSTLTDKPILCLVQNKSEEILRDVYWINNNDNTNATTTTTTTSANDSTDTDNK